MSVSFALVYTDDYLPVASQTDDDFTFESFVESFDEGDRFTRRLFEFLIRDAVVRRRRERRLDRVEDAQNAVIHRQLDVRWQGIGIGDDDDDDDDEGAGEGQGAQQRDFARRMRALRAQRQRLIALAERPAVSRRLRNMLAIDAPDANAAAAAAIAAVDPAARNALGRPAVDDSNNNNAASDADGGLAVGLHIV
eukprot:Opistho-2@9795